MPLVRVAGAVFAFESVQDGSDADEYHEENLHFQEEPWCTFCQSRPASGLKCCSRCQTAWYCNNKCRKAHYHWGHKEICLTVAEDLNRVEQLAISLRNARFANVGFNNEPQNLFETQIGAFGRWEETRAYMAARLNLVEAYWYAACRVDVKNNWEKALFHALELQRLEISGISRVRFLIPLILLKLHRDDDAFDFIRYWMKRQHANRETLMELRRRHAESREGDWIYPREKNCRFLGIHGRVPVEFIVALFIIKFGVVSNYDATCKSIDLFFESTDGQRIQEVQCIVKEMLIDDSLVNIDSQRQQVQRLVAIIHRMDPSILPAGLRPSSRRAIDRPEERDTLIENARPEEEHVPLQPRIIAFFILCFVYCIRCLTRVPGAKAMLKYCFGKHPSFDQ